MLIASRLLKIRSGHGDTSVAVRLFSPERDDGGWRCRYEIDWPNGKKSGAAAGVDSLQALVIALQKIGIEVYTSDHHKNGKLSWDRPGHGYGFPVAAIVRDVLQGDDKQL